MKERFGKMGRSAFTFPIRGAALALAIALCLVCGAPLARAEAMPVGNRLGFEVLELLADGTANQFVSPVSLAYALSMAALGADGDTKAELLSALEADAPETVVAWSEALASDGLRQANAAFIKEDFPVLPEYLEALGQFDAEVFPLDGVERANAWVDAHTDHLIERLLETLPDAMQLMLVNAVAMDCEWRVPFDGQDTWESTFHAPNGDVRAEFMHDTRTMAYGERDGVQYARLDYAEGGLYMLVALPPEGGAGDLLAALSEEGLSWFSQMDYAEVALALPKLDASVSNSLVEALQALGVQQAFEATADFSGISEESLLIGDVLQKVRVQVDEEGTRAAAVTAIIMFESAAAPDDGPQPIPMVVDRPYVVIIADEATGAVCFAGAVVDPTAE